MIGIITGDIINSKEADPKKWLKPLKSVLNYYGEEPKHWEIFRGDSFQLELLPEQALEACIIIKSSIKQFKTLDVRLAIGIGDKTYKADKITESNGSAFVNSGECFEQLKKSTLAIKSPFKTFDEQINIMLDLASLTMNSWKPTTSKTIKTSIEHPELNQVQLAKLLEKTQSNISESLKRAGFDEISKLLQYYKTQIQTLC